MFNILHVFYEASTKETFPPHVGQCIVAWAW